MLDKFAIANALREIALLLELKQENPYKTRAFVTGAAALEAVTEDIDAVIAGGGLTKIRGIGESLAAVIAELYQSGQSATLNQLREEMPPGVVELSKVPGLSVKKVQALHSALGITSVPQLEAACRAGQVRNLSGFGLKTEQNILENIRLYESREDAELLLHATELTEQLKHYLLSKPQIKQAEIAGSVRRWQETVHNINIVTECADADAAFEALQSFPLVTRCQRPASDRAIVRLASGMRVYLRIAADKNEFPAAWLIETASKEHIDALKELAHQRGYELGPAGLKKGSQVVRISSEAEIYKHLGLPFVPPELRESADNIQEALSGATFEDLITESDIQGMTHCHTVYSDGKNTVEQMVRAAEALGMKYITITDHSPAAHYAGGVEIERLKMQWAEIDEVQEKVPNVRILRGTESDILEDGSLDYPDAILEKFDIIIASIHARMKMDSKQMTRRIVNCMKKKEFKIWGHALGRLLLRREPFACDVEEILDVVAESNAAIEVNGDPHRLDMEPRWIRQARKRNIPFIISVDAHSTAALSYLKYGVHIARRGGLRKHEVLNTLPVDVFAQRVKP